MWAVALIVVLVPVSSSSAGVEGETVYPTMAGLTTIHARGITAIKMRVPEDVKWFTGNIELKSGPEVHKVLAAIRYQRDAFDLCELCFLGTFAEDSPNSPFARPFVGSCYDDPGNEVGCTIEAGVVEIYIVSDGEVTFTMSFPELSGQLELEATGAIEGAMEKIPVTCLLPDCSIVGGGKAIEIGQDGRASHAAVTAWAYAEGGIVNPSEAKAVACAYPGYFNSRSGNPSDHPYGCDIDDPLGDEAGTNFWIPFTGPNGGGVSWSAGAGKTHGLQYLGFNARHRGTLEPSSFDAYGYWINEGIACPSGDFFNCGNET